MYKTHMEYCVLLTLGLFLILPNAYAEMSKCKLANGSYYFTDTGCNGSVLVEKTKMPKIANTLPSINNRRSSNDSNPVQGGCSAEDKARADEHFEEAKKINNSYAYTIGEMRDRKRRYKHEITYAKSILAACSGSNAPALNTNTFKCRSSGQHYGSTSYGQTTCE